MFSSQVYSPTLRLKLGEYTAFTELGSAVTRRVLPSIVVPPPSENDPEKGRPLTPQEMIHESGERIGKYWPSMPCLVDPRFLFGVFEESETDSWLPLLFETARYHNARATPIASLEDFDRGRTDAFKKAGKCAERGVAIRVELAHLDDFELPKRLQRALSSSGQQDSETVLIMDLSSADLSNVETVTEFTLSAFQRLMDAGLWQRVIVEATSYPESNPAPRAGEALLPRNEWLAWRAAARADRDFDRLAVFADFGADSAKFKFKGGGIPIGHYRYSTPDSWFVVREDDTKHRSEGMRDVCNRIVESDHFAGHSFSRADAYIAECAAGNDGPGSASIWRKVNTVHHITRVVVDVGALRGFSIPSLPRSAPVPQLDLFR